MHHKDGLGAHGADSSAYRVKLFRKGDLFALRGRELGDSATLATFV
jgi:hypothetical protein